MARSGQEIQAALKRFAAKWQTYTGTERAEAQTFLNELFTCYGSDRQAVGAVFEDFTSSAGFMDLHWPGVAIVEMKKPGAGAAGITQSARDQVKRYWEESSDPETDTPAARWVVLCSFTHFEIWEPGRFPGKARISLPLAELPDRYDALNFLAGPSVEPVFAEHYRTLTTQATEKVALAYQSLIDRAAAPADEIQRFILQSVWTMFAEDLGMLSGYPYQTTLSTLIREPDRSSAEALGYLFRLLNQKTNHNRTGVFAGTTYVNGQLFADPAEVDLNPDELTLLREATEFDWRKVEPTIFGSLMEGVLGERRWELGAHYTHETDIMKIVTPTIVRPWQQRIDQVDTPAAARELLEELCQFRVLDPACGCGNFLYVAYRELRTLEHQLKTTITDLARTTGLPAPPGPVPFVKLANMQGIDIEPAAVLIARVTLWMGHRQMIDRYGEAEKPLPLVTLSNIRAGDALNVAWPETDCIIGNPPFQGASHLREAFGDAYLSWLQKAFKVGIKDFCVYWFRKTHAHLGPGQRAGLVGTNSISQNFGRSASLAYITSNAGTITDAISSQKWPGEAKVHVSLVNWIKDSKAAGPFTLDGLDVPGVGPDLRPASGSSWTPMVLTANARRCFEGPSPKAKGLLIERETADELLADTSVNYREVIRPYLTANDITDDPNQAPTRWVIDFGLKNLEQANRYPRALAIVRKLVKPERETNNRKAYREKWWQFAEPRRGMRTALSGLPRYIATAGHAKRAVFTWVEPWTLASNATDVFAFEDEFAMAVLQSHAHVAWAWHQSSTLETRLRYTPTSVFMTFPWPDTANEQQRAAAAAVSREMLARRADICVSENIGLTTFYNAMDEGAYADVRGLQQGVDEAVVACYGWPRKIAQNDAELVARLRALNREFSEGNRTYEPF